MSYDNLTTRYRLVSGAKNDGSRPYVRIVGPLPAIEKEGTGRWARTYAGSAPASHAVPRERISVRRFMPAYANDLAPSVSIGQFAAREGLLARLEQFR